MTFRRGQLDGVPGSGDLAATVRSREFTRSHSGEHGAPDSSPGSSRSWFPGRTQEVQFRRPGPAPGPRPAAAQTHPRRRPGGPSPSPGSPGGHSSPAPQAGPPPRGLRKPRLSWLQLESARPLSSGRLRAGSSRRRSPTRGGGVWAAGGGGGGLGTPRSREIHPPAGRSAAAAADHFRGAGSGAESEGKQLPVRDLRGGCGGRGWRTMAGGSGPAGVHPPRAEGGLHCLSGDPTPGLCARRGEVTSPGPGRGRGPRRVSRISAPAPRHPCLSSGDQEGVLGKGGGERRPPSCFQGAASSPGAS